MSGQFERLRVALADRYSIERELGSGGMATVYLAEDLKHCRKVVRLLADCPTPLPAFSTPHSHLSLIAE